MTTETTTTPTKPIEPLAAANVVHLLPLAELRASKLNPRQRFDNLDALADSIRAKGILVPLIVRQRPGAFEVVDGERRFRAAKLAGLITLPALRHDNLTDAEVLELQIVSAVQRADLTPLEEARGFAALIKASPSKVSAAYIADRIGRSERFVLERIRLLELIPEAQQLLEQERIGVALADLLSQLSPADQARAIAPGGKARRGYAAPSRPGGLWDYVGATLLDELTPAAKDDADRYAGLKPVTVREFEEWIARHVRFDPARAAAAAPLDFGQTATRIAVATQQPGRGAKVVRITHDHHLGDDVRDPKERVYGPRSWRRADGSTVARPIGGGKPYVAQDCEHKILGVVTVGPEYGSAFHVCIARDKCTVHWKTEINAKKRADRLRKAGQGGKANAAEAKRRSKQQNAEAIAAAKRARDLAVFRRVHPRLLEALRAALPSTLDDARVYRFVWQLANMRGDLPKPASPSAVLRALVEAKIDNPAQLNEYSATWALPDALELAALFGVDGPALAKAAGAELDAEAKAAKAAPTVEGAPAKAANGKRAKAAAKK